MDTFPRLYTERLILRKIEVEDFSSLVSYANNQKISDRIINIPFPFREPDAAFRMSYIVQGFKKGIRYVFAIIDKSKSVLIGEISLNLDASKKKAELGYWLGEPFWGHGIMTEALGAVLGFGFGKLDLDWIFASTSDNNIGSIKVLEKHKFEFTKLKGQTTQAALSKLNYLTRLTG